MVRSKFGVAVCTLNQLALDFQGNLDRILASIEKSIQLGATVRVGPELEVTGYGCEDAFYELDTVYHSWQMVAEVLKKNYQNILINLSMPVRKDSALYNCQLVILNSKIVLIRPKNRLAINGNYRENRWFTAWGDGTQPTMAWFNLPNIITELNGQKRVPFGDAAILEFPNRSVNSFDLSSTANCVRLGYEICEELWQADTQCSRLFGQRAVHLVLNVSGSYWELRKLDSAFTHARSATSKSGGVYAYTNAVGCDGGGRLCTYGRSFVMLNGQLLAQATQTRETLFDESEVIVAWVDPNQIEEYRSQLRINTRSFLVEESVIIFDAKQGAAIYEDPRTDANVSGVTVIAVEGFDILKESNQMITTPIKVELRLSPEEEILRYCCLWLWDYLRRCIPGGIRGFIVPLSGGLDSCSVACIVYCLAEMLHYQVYRQQNLTVIEALKPIFDVTTNPNGSAKDICQSLLRCVYLQTNFSGADSLDRAQKLAQLVGAQFESYNFTHLYKSVVDSAPRKVIPKPGEAEVTLQQQNLQARLRMVLTYYMSECNRLVLATGNVDEALVGYLTKYDCSSADINPIGSIAKNDLKRFVRFCIEIIPNSNEVLERILNATPSAELTGEEQKDEDDLGLTYDMLSLFGSIRRGENGDYGPYGMFTKIWDNRNQPNMRKVFGDDQELNPEVLATKVKRFWTLYSRNRHKQTILTPALHTETYSPDDNRFDHRQFLFNTKWPWQFAQIDNLVAAIKNKEVN